MQPSVLDGRSRIRKQESLDPDEELSTAVPAVHEAEVMSGGCTDQDETIDIGPGPYDAFKSCHSSAELLALPNYFNVIRAIFNEHPNEKLKCPNETCSREFTNTQSIISHAQNCALTKTRRSRKKDSSSPNRAHKKREAPKQYECYRDYKGHASSWAVLSTADKMSLIANEFERSKIKRIPCLNPDCSLRMKEVDEVLDHVNRCYLPEYFTYLGRAAEFRALDKKEQGRITRKALGVVDCLPCLNIDVLHCEQTYSHFYGLIYHIQRCGVGDEDRPWKCYRCGYTSTFLQSKEHLAECHRNELAEIVEKAQELAEREAVFEENESDQEATTQQKKQEKADSILRKLMKSVRLRGPQVSVSRGVVPEHSSRTSITAGFKRYKFKSVDLGVPVPSADDLRNYQAALSCASDAFDRARDAEPLCRSLLQVEFNYGDWTTVPPEERSELLNGMLEKCSVPVRLPSMKNNHVDGRHSPAETNGIVTREGANETAQRLAIFVPHALHYTVPARKSPASEPSTSSSDTMEGDGCIVYCGGPISMITSCPRLLEDGSECVAVSVFPDEEYLIDRNSHSNIGYLQFWRYRRNANNVSAKLSFLLEMNIGVILSAVWCPLLRGKVNIKTENERKSNFIGILAVGGMEGGVVIYVIPHEELNNNRNSEEVRVIRGSPNLILRLPENHPDSPVISLAWSEFDGAARLAAVYASGCIGVWDMNNASDPARIIFSDEWASPPMHIAFGEHNKLAIAFREKFLRIYDLSSEFKCIIEESAPRSAGMKVTSCERIFPGTFSYQGDCITSSEFLEHTMCYITMAPTNNFFVVPLAFRHEVRIWDAAICPRSGCVYTAGADGRLQVSLNGRIVPRHAKIDFPFNCWRVAMTLVRKLKTDPVSQKETTTDANSLMNGLSESQASGEEEQQLRAVATDLESSSEHFTLEFSFDDVKHGKSPIDQISLDLRLESLNRIAVSQTFGKLAICGGEAGLLIFLPCEL